MAGTLFSYAATLLSSILALSSPPSPLSSLLPPISSLSPLPSPPTYFLSPPTSLYSTLSPLSPFSLRSLFRLCPLSSIPSLPLSLCTYEPLNICIGDILHTYRDDSSMIWSGATFDHWSSDMERSDSLMQISNLIKLSPSAFHDVFRMSQTQPVFHLFGVGLYRVGQ